MTGPAAGDPDAGILTTTGRGIRGSIAQALALLGIGLALRLLIVTVLPGSGFGVDLDAFRFWAADLARNGPWGFYDRGFFADYTPGYLYLLWLVGIVGTWLGGIGDLIKAPALLADLAIAWLVRSLAIELGAPPRRALAAAALVLLFPVSWFDSAVWGQVDSVGVVFLLLGLRAIWRERAAEAALWATVAAVVKPQLGILVPILVAWTVGRTLADRVPGGGPAAILRRLGVAAAGPLVVALATASALAAPFALALPGLLGQVGSAAAGYPYLSVNAYNPWALLGVDGHGIAADGTWVRDVVDGQGPGLAFGPVPAIAVGTTLLVLAILAIGVVVVRRPTRSTVLVGLAVLAVAFFVLPTRVHERYLYPFFVLGTILAAASPRWRVPWLVASSAMFLGMYVVLTTLYPGNPQISDWLGIGPAIRSGAGVALVALAHTAVLVWAALRLRSADLARFDAELAASRSPVPVATPAATQVATPVPPPGPRDRLRLPALLRGLHVPPYRADRSAALNGEGVGRFDRLDAWILVVLAISLLGLRLYRLELPHGMHFDEVYHARTATEFLQDWRYGEPHAIYEFTHPHLAKYAIAAGLVVAGNDRVTGTSTLGTPVAGVALEGRWGDARLPGGRAGDRLYVATGDEVRAVDLASRAVVATLPVPGATTLAVSASRHELYVGTRGGAILALPTVRLDELRVGGAPPQPALLRSVATLDGPVDRLLATADGTLVASVGGAALVSLEPESGRVLGSLTLPDIAGMAEAGSAESVVATGVAPADVDAVADRLASILGGSSAAYRPALVDASAASFAVVAPAPSGEERTTLETALADGSLPGLEIRALARVAVGTADGIALVAPSGPTLVESLPTDMPVTGLAATSGIEPAAIHAAAGSDLVVLTLPKEGERQSARISSTLPMPGAVTDVAWDPASELTHVLGRTADGRPTVYVVEPHGVAVFADAVLPFEPVAWTLDAQAGYPDQDRQELLAFGADGATAAVDIGRHAFAWRLPGALAGVLTALLLYVLARLLFRRRAVAVLVGVAAALDGMLFVQSRIAMNDAYVGLFLVAAVVVFAGLWTGRWRHPLAFWLLMPVAGVLLGLALASKWVALYAIAGLGILVLARSALGRVVLVGGLLAATAVLGFMGLSVPDGGTSGGNLLFMLLMIGLTLATVVVVVLRPVAWTLEEVRFAIGAPLALGIAIPAFGLPLGLIGGPPCAVGAGMCVEQLLLAAAFGLVGVSALAALLIGLGRMVGWGPLGRNTAPPEGTDAPAPAPEGWLRLGSGLGLPALWLAVSLVGIPLAVYVASYLPWVALGNRLLGSWPAENTGQTLLELTQSMYRYHNDLRATHAASSPWWAWPFDLKPVWFYQGSFEGGTAGAIYDAGNLVLWWLGVPALAWTAWTAFRRRSHSLALVAILFLALWVPWARIDRATFQYHYYTSLPFTLLALAAFAAELWHGPSRGTWALARISAAVAIVAPVALWLLRLPLCWIVGVERVNAGSEACALVPPGEILLTVRTAGLLVIGVAAVVAIARGALGLDRPGARLLPLVLVAAAASFGLVLASRLLDETPLLRIDGFPPEAVAIVLLVPVGLLAWFVALARDARRFVAGLVVAAAGWFVLWYPNLTGLAMPSDFHNAYQGLLPTYLYPFQFPVNTDPAGGSVSLASWPFAVVAIALTLTVVAVAYSAAAWRTPDGAEEAAGSGGADGAGDAEGAPVP